MAEITIEYDGSYPNLCSGVLVVVVDGERWKFPPHCMSPGGSVSFDDDWSETVTQGAWDIGEWPHLFPEELKHDVINAVNCQVEWGNCGGCV